MDNDVHYKLAEKVAELSTKHDHLHSKVTNHDAVIEELAEATKDNTDAIRDLNNIISNGVRTVKTIGYTFVVFYLLSTFGLPEVVKAMAGIKG